MKRLGQFDPASSEPAQFPPDQDLGRTPVRVSTAPDRARAGVSMGAV
jgi:hypothetical protein